MDEVFWPLSGFGTGLASSLIGYVLFDLSLAGGTGGKYGADPVG